MNLTVLRTWIYCVGGLKIYSDKKKVEIKNEDNNLENNEIINYIYKNIDIRKFIRKVISTSYYDQSYLDLEQYIYLYLLEYDNVKLNRLYQQKNALKFFIIRIIFNQRNYYKSYYNEYLKILENEQVDYSLEDDIEVVNMENLMKIEFINKELKKYIGKRKDLTEENRYEMLCYEVYRVYLRRGYTIRKLSTNLKLNVRTVSNILKSAKVNIKNNYYKKYGND